MKQTNSVQCIAGGLSNMFPCRDMLCLCHQKQNYTRMKRCPLCILPWLSSFEFRTSEACLSQDKIEQFTYSCFSQCLCLAAVIMLIQSHTISHVKTAHCSLQHIWQPLKRFHCGCKTERFSFLPSLKFSPFGHKLMSPFIITPRRL